jgi:dipeptidyl aminopeptidase/acylaminoacyl peptidase
MQEEDDSLHSAIWLVDLDGTNHRQLTNGEALDSQPAWSPDGSRLAFVSTRTGKPQLYALDFAGGEPRKLTDEERGASSPIWSPDGARLAYIADTALQDHLVEEETAWLEGHSKAAEKNGPKLRRVTALKYRFDALGYLESRGHLCLIDAAGGEPKRLTEGSYSETGPAWSPDGREIAFLSDRSEDGEFVWSTAVWLVDVDSGALRRLTSEEMGPFTGGLSWSPDGKSLAFYSSPDITRVPYGDTHVWLVSREGNDERDLSGVLDRPSTGMVGTDHAFAQPVAPAWSPDGQTLYFPLADHGDQPLWAIDVATQESRRVSQGHGQCGGAQLTPDGETLVCIATTATQPLVVCTVPAPGGSLTRITHVNQELFDEVQLSEPERLAFKGAKDWDVEGWLLPPLDAELGTPFPVVLFIHGGPWGAYGNAFSMQRQILAGAGMGSLYINPRGSTGYGQAFAGANDWGLDDYQDLMAGVDHVVEGGLADPTRLAVTGISYGGYMTDWVIGHTNRFACALSENGICNLISFAGTADVGPMWFHRELDGPFWASPELMQRFIFHSPITYVAQMETPLLLVQAENDYRCPIEQGEQLFSALRMRRQPVEMIRIPNASHGVMLSAAPHHRVEHWQIAQSWFARYLLGKAEPEETPETPTLVTAAETVPTGG